jgi:hypothetical protein
VHYVTEVNIYKNTVRVNTHQIKRLLLVVVPHRYSIHVQHRRIPPAFQAAVLLDGLEYPPRIVAIPLVPRQPPSEEEGFNGLGAGCVIELVSVKSRSSSKNMHQVSPSLSISYAAKQQPAENE